MEQSEQYKYLAELINKAKCRKNKSAIAMAIKMAFMSGEITSNEQFILNLRLNERL